ncbi:sensor histidine kinase [Bacillus sp. B1-b2]|uniref:sensor histidine kinase n=1 Tax=Bacillus sp. B1-b2 TaxID=2653201 RepID=UPI0012627D0D|nr:sensor histidine kinase [Bacillus sp. B1-b2]KAB7665365.1 sensor histidine kinase [Bacillus sp. B1-b2]
MANRYRLFIPIFTTSLVSSLILFVMMQVYITLKPQSIFSSLVTLMITAILFITNLLAGAYFSRKMNSTIKKQLDDILWYLSALRRGKIPKDIASLQNEMTYDIKTELFDLSTYQQELVSSLQRLANEKASLGQTAHQAAVMEERQRLARDLHDVVSQQLFALNMMSSAAFKMFDRNPELVKEQLKDIVMIAGKAQGEMRALLLHLRPVELSNDSLCDGLIKLIQELKGKTSITFSASIDEIEQLSTAGEEHLFRIVQEALSNVLRHSYADKVRIILEERENYVYLHISDNGKGFNPSIEKMASYGLKTMKERSEEIGGVMEIRSKSGEGTYIDIRVPTEGWKND